MKRGATILELTWCFVQRALPGWPDPARVGPGRTVARSTGQEKRLSRLTADIQGTEIKAWRDDRPRTRWLFDSGDAMTGRSDHLPKQRLSKRHSETVFVTAESGGRGRPEEFHDHAVLRGHHLSLERLLHTVSGGDIVVERRMHVTAAGQARHHVTAFRIRKDPAAAIQADQ